MSVMFEPSVNLNALFPPNCPECGPKGVIKPDVILFGEKPPGDVFEAADVEARQCEVMIIIGSSLNVTPAAFIPIIASSSGAKLILVNRESTEMDHYMDVHLFGSAGTILPELAREVARILAEEKYLTEES